MVRILFLDYGGNGRLSVFLGPVSFSKISLYKHKNFRWISNILIQYVKAQEERNQLLSGETARRKQFCGREKYVSIMEPTKTIVVYIHYTYCIANTAQQIRIL